ncbi:MAG: hypothetical protein JKX75_04880, partial [Gammaproteobacteria bacterium]|nr:hypothetical protein [Gammaproteobacteria bacterium]
DLVRNFYGVLAGLFFVAFLDIKNQPQLYRRKALFVLFSIVFFMIGVTPLLKLSWHYIERHNAFPVVVGFDRNWSSSFVQFKQSEIVVTPTFDKNNYTFHQVRFYPGKYPGFSIVEPEPDWSSYRSLRFSIYSKKAYQLTLRIHDDAHNLEYVDRFNKKLYIRSGFSEFIILLDEVRLGPESRELDLAHIAGLALFSSDLKTQMQFAFSNIYLE